MTEEAASLARLFIATRPPPRACADGTRFTDAGPPAYAGVDILDLGADALWCEDVWTAERRAAAAARVLARDGAPGGVLPRGRAAMYERDAQRSWDLFYRRNGDRFFHDRHYLHAACQP